MRNWIGMILITLGLVSCSNYDHKWHFFSRGAKPSYKIFAVDHDKHIYYAGISSVSKQAAGIQALKLCHSRNAKVNVCRLQ